MKKELYLIEALNIFTWYNGLSDDKLDKIDFKVRWALKKAISKITSDVNAFQQMRDEEVKRLQAKWFTNEFSETFAQPIVDKDGNEVKDEFGNVETEEMRRVKSEYMKDYQNEIDALNRKINEVLYEKNAYEYNSADVDGFVRSLDDPAPLEFKDLEVLDALLSEN